MPYTIYVASHTKHARMWRSLRASGYPIISTWIDEAGEGESEDLEDLAVRCVNEAMDADYVILYSAKGDTLRGALIEAGAALAAGKLVFAVGYHHPVFQFHPRWITSATLESALRSVSKQHKGNVCYREQVK